MADHRNHPPSSTLHPQRILVRGVNWLGDAVMTAPALMRLREQFPNTHIALLSLERIAPLWQHHPVVDEVIPFDSDEGVFRVGRKLRAGQFDLALILPNSPRSAVETWLAGIPQRIGYARAWRNRFLTCAVPSRAGAVKMRKRSVAEIKLLISKRSGEPAAPGRLPASAHQIYEYLHLAATLGASAEPMPPQLFVEPGEIEAACEKFDLQEQTGPPILGLNPGAEYGPAKRWPAERFVEAARLVQQRTKCRWILLGGRGDAEIVLTIQSALDRLGISVLNLAGRTSLRELMAVLKLCRVLLTNDTGPMHVAAAVGTPVVVPFGSTSPDLTGPGMPGDSRHQPVRSHASCAPCFLRECPIDFRCMNGISAGQIAEAVLRACA